MCQIRYVKSHTMFPMIREFLSHGKSVQITVTGMSMYPFLRESQDSVELSNTGFSEIKYGDIVMILRDSGEYIMHRVIRKEQNCFYMIGDAQEWVEGPLRPDQLVALVTSVWRRSKRIDCKSPVWKFLSMAWLKLLPFRGFILKVHGILRG